MVSAVIREMIQILLAGRGEGGGCIDAGATKTPGRALTKRVDSNAADRRGVPVEWC